MKLHTSLIIVFFVLFYQGVSQIAPNTYYIQFTDKNNSPYSINSPEEFLSQRAIERRVIQGIEILENDLPVNPQYIQGVSNAGALILNATKWLNGVTVYTESQTVIDNILALPFVSSALKMIDREVGKHKNFFENESYSDVVPGSYKKGRSSSELNYGAAENQIDQINGIPLHDLGYQGQGMVIAVLDGGFEGALEHPVFDSLWTNNQILGTRDFVLPYDQNVFSGSPHGKSVLSTMGANLPGQMIGTAPKAFYWLLRSEYTVNQFENIIEEYNWVSAAEFADSVGADIINSSLSYREFDLPQWDHTYEDLDGNTAPATKGADFAASKGILVCNSAGNSGNGEFPWNAAPADADSVFSIGAVDGSGNKASFSSIGPTVDGRIKPAVMAQGQGTIVARNTEDIGSGNGTSYSSPLIAGMSACLWQANPSMKVMEIQEAIKQSATLANNPNNEYGWGIPDFMEAHTIMTNLENQIDDNKTLTVKAWPNPFNTTLNIKVSLKTEQFVTAELYNTKGTLVFFERYSVTDNSNISLFENQLDKLNGGIYFLKINSVNEFITLKLIKQ